MIIWKFVLLIVFHQCYAEKDLVFVSDKNVCVKENIRSCCYNYYYDNGECKVCKPGQRSTDGRTCSPCPSNTYGEICGHKCSCTFEQTCDPILGCINSFTLKTGETIQSTADRFTDHLTQVLNVITVATETKTEDQSTMIYFLVVAGGLIGWLLFCFAVGWLIYKRLSKTRPVTQAEGSSQDRNSQGSTSLVPLPTENFYHEIEEIATPQLPSKRSSSYLSVFDTQSSDSNPVTQSFVECKSEINIEEKISTESAKSSLSSSSETSVCNQIVVHAGDYLHPYNSLDKTNQQTEYDG